MNYQFDDGDHPPSIPATVARCPTYLRGMVQPGALRIVSDGAVTIDGGAATAAFFKSPKVVTIEIGNPTSLQVESALDLSALTVAELQEIVNWAGVDTEAQTATGLRRAIERHLEA